MHEIKDFYNEPFTNFQDSKEKQNMKQAIQTVSKQLGKKVPLVIDGKRIFTEKEILSVNPSKKEELVGKVSAASVSDVEHAHLSAQQAFETWRFTPASERIEILLNVAARMRERKHEFSAWMVLEAGKNWREADADTAEAIDFLEYYALQMGRMTTPEPLVSVQHEANHYEYLPLGVGVVLPPWNFPVAILTGMVASSIVTGNTVLLKPSELTSVVAYEVYQLFEEAGVPKGVIQFIPGYGSEIGDYLVEHPKTRFISFTGSKTVGCRIYEKAAKVQKGQIWLKRVVAEMGGKDGVVVDETADIERAAQAIVDSAFGFQGQKCSAGSRAIVVESVYDQVLEKVIEKTKTLTMGSPLDNHPIGPVSDEKAFRKVIDYIDIGMQEGCLVLGGNANASKGYYIEPTIFAQIEEQHRLFQEEVFGPVLSFTKANDYKDAIRLFNATEYGLTGAFHSTNEDRINEAMHTMHCGNLYINKKCTGALVGVHPFGGFNMSGTDSKAGGPDYLLQFVQPKTITRLVD